MSDWPRPGPDDQRMVARQAVEQARCARHPAMASLRRQQVVVVFGQHAGVDGARSAVVASVTSPAPMRAAAAGDEIGRADVRGRAGEHHHLAEGALVAIRRARGQQRAHGRRVRAAPGPARSASRPVGRWRRPRSSPTSLAPGKSSRPSLGKASVTVRSAASRPHPPRRCRRSGRSADPPPAHTSARPLLRLLAHEREQRARMRASSGRDWPVPRKASATTSACATAARNAARSSPAGMRACAAETGAPSTGRASRARPTPAGNGPSRARRRRCCPARPAPARAARRPPRPVLAQRLGHAAAGVLHQHLRGQAVLAPARRSISRICSTVTTRMPPLPSLNAPLWRGRRDET